MVGIDQSPQMLAAARARFASGASAVARRACELIEGQAESLPFADASFDGLTFTYLLRYVDDPAATVRELARVVRPGGRVASLEFGVPPWAPARAAWRLYTAVGLPTLGRLASREWAQVGRFLGPSIRGFYERHPLERIVGYWQQAGLQDVRVRRDEPRRRHCDVGDQAHRLRAMLHRRATAGDASASCFLRARAAAASAIW